MKQNLYKGRFIVFEGLDGSGQSTQVKLLKEYFDRQGLAAILTKEPTQWTEAGKKIKDALEGREEIAPLKLQELFCEDRREHLEKEIIPVLKNGKIVVCDRYFFSTLAFGGINVPIEKLKILNQDFLYPDMIFYLQVRPEVCVERINQRGKGVKFFEKLEKLKKVAANYAELAKKFQGVKVLNGEKKIKEIHQEVLMTVKKLLEEEVKK